MPKERSIAKSTRFWLGVEDTARDMAIEAKRRLIQRLEAVKPEASATCNFTPAESARDLVASLANEKTH